MLHHPARALPGAVLTPYLARYTLVLLSSTMTISTRSSRPSCTSLPRSQGGRLQVSDWEGGEKCAIE